jgi:hypothetical protein
MKKAFAALAAGCVLVLLPGAYAGSTSALFASVVGTNVVASSPFEAGGYPVPPGETAP